MTDVQQKWFAKYSVPTLCFAVVLVLFSTAVSETEVLFYGAIGSLWLGLAMLSVEYIDAKEYFRAAGIFVLGLLACGHLFLAV